METGTRDNSAAELLRAAIAALAHADAAQLEGLVEAARGVRRFKTAEERRLAQQGLRTLGALIAVTRRNLRLLRGAGGYGALRE